MKVFVIRLQRWLTGLAGLVTLMVLASCAGPARMAEGDEPMHLSPARYGTLPGWQEDRHQAALEAFVRSCKPMLNRDPQARLGDFPVPLVYADIHAPCRAAMSLENRDDPTARKFFEAWFQPYQVRGARSAYGRFTGYYEPLLHGATTRGGPYQTPLRGRPGDLVSVDLGLFRSDLKGRRIAGKIAGGRLLPYPERGEIVTGGIPEPHENVLFWVDDPVDAFFLQIQGSGLVELQDGTHVRVGYAGQNGRPYYAIGRSLIRSGAIQPEDVSLFTIRQWLEANPESASRIMNENKSYVFFRVLGESEGPLGAQGVPLTPGRSLAVDDRFFGYGLPVWVDIEHPDTEQDPQRVIRRLMVAQDTGGAIRGPVRGDFFWGHGAEAARLAGIMNQRGRKWILLPRKTGEI